MAPKRMRRAPKKGKKLKRIKQTTSISDTSGGNHERSFFLLKTSNDILQKGHYRLNHTSLIACSNYRLSDPKTAQQKRSIEQNIQKHQEGDEIYRKARRVYFISFILRIQDLMKDSRVSEGTIIEKSIFTPEVTRKYIETLKKIRQNS